MQLDHHYALLYGYATALIGWLIVARLYPSPWRGREKTTFEHPWREPGWALLAVVGVFLIGQLYVRDWLLPAQTLGDGVFVKL